MASLSPTPVADGGASFAAKYLCWVPLLTPAVESNGWNLNRNLVCIRSMVCFVAGAILATTVTKWIPPLSRLSDRLNHAFLARSASAWQIVSALAFLALAVTPVIALCIFEERRANRAIDQRAVNEYLSEGVPSRLARRHILENLSAAQLLVARGGDVNKLDENGRHLLSDPLMDLDAFKILVNNGFNLARREGNHPSGFQVAVRNGPPYLQYLVEQRLVQVQDFTPDDQVMCWVYANPDSIPLLLDCGFDINVRSNGVTPLALLENHSGADRNERLITLLRQHGATL